MNILISLDYPSVFGRRNISLKESPLGPIQREGRFPGVQGCIPTLWPPVCGSGRSPWLVSGWAGIPRKAGGDTGSRAQQDRTPTVPARTPAEGGCAAP